MLVIAYPFFPMMCFVSGGRLHTIRTHVFCEMVRMVSRRAQRAPGSRHRHRLHPRRRHLHHPYHLLHRCHRRSGSNHTSSFSLPTISGTTTWGGEVWALLRSCFFDCAVIEPTGQSVIHLLTVATIKSQALALHSHTPTRALLSAACF